MPFAGKIEITTEILNNACTTIPVIIPMPSSIPNLSGASKAARVPRHKSSPNAMTTASVPIKPNSSPTTAKNKVRIRIRQIEKFLLTFGETFAENAARTDGVKSLNDLVTAVRRMFPRVHKGEKSLHTKRRQHQSRRSEQQ